MGSQKDQTLRLHFDLGKPNHGWMHGFADYPDGSEDYYELKCERRALPKSLGAGHGLYIQGNNHSDDLFMFLKRKVGSADGLAPERQYRLSFAVTFGSDAPSGCAGVGGAPGESVAMKVGGSAVEPESQVVSGTRTMNIDKGIQSLGGADASTSGDIANGDPCPPGGVTSPYRRVTRKRVHERPVRASAAGALWLLVGTDSGYEGKTGIYYLSVSVELEPVAP